MSVRSGSRLQRGGSRGEDSAVQTSGLHRAAAAATVRPRRAAGWRPHRGHHRRSEGSRLNFNRNTNVHNMKIRVSRSVFKRHSLKSSAHKTHRSTDQSSLTFQCLLCLSPVKAAVCLDMYPHMTRDLYCLCFVYLTQDQPQ